MQIITATFAGMLGLVFGSFLNVVLSRLPEGESIVSPGSHCRHCDHTLSWWENIPLVSWILLKGRCRSCNTPISFRYPLVELTVALLWSACALKFWHPAPSLSFLNPHPSEPASHQLIAVLGYATLCWLLVALAALDLEFLWLPDRLTLPGIALGVTFSLLELGSSTVFRRQPAWLEEAWSRLIEILAAAAVILGIRLAYWLVRRKEGMGLGDAKLMGLLAAWLGLIGALESFAVAVLGATVAALLWLLYLAIRRKSSQWASLPLPLGTFLALAAIAEVFRPAWLWNWWSQTFLIF